MPLSLISNIRSNRLFGLFYKNIRAMKVSEFEFYRFFSDGYGRDHLWYETQAFWRRKASNCWQIFSTKTLPTNQIFISFAIVFQSIDFWFIEHKHENYKESKIYLIFKWNILSEYYYEWRLIEVETKGTTYYSTINHIFWLLIMYGRQIYYLKWARSIFQKLLRFR
jgi:hypothetical protein